MCTVFSVFKITCISRLDFPMNLEAWLTLRVSTKELKRCVRYSAKERDAGSADLGLLACSEFPGTRALTELIGSHIFPRSAALPSWGRQEGRRPRACMPQESLLQCLPGTWRALRFLRACVFSLLFCYIHEGPGASLPFESGTKDPGRLMEACPTEFLMACSWPGDTHSFWVEIGGPGVWVLVQELGLGGSLLGVPGERLEKRSAGDLGRWRGC